ncbi:helix-turn-helix transcriptional regulator [Acrocarpospora sp. B8E8]|uniref:helix-turn-helix domain-containing protein n=1 Tax=Acrocarpospora sp. B8E8 TaxID=3153572 RepID=UPI00325FB8F1
MAAFACALRDLRRWAGAPSYREMAQKAHFSVTALSQAAAGGRLPSWEVTAAYVIACGGDEQEWRWRWEAAATPIIGTGQPGIAHSAAVAGTRVSDVMPATRPAGQNVEITRPDPMAAQSLPELTAMLEQLRRMSGLSLRQLEERSLDTPGMAGQPTVLSRSTVSDLLRGVREPRWNEVLRIAELCGSYRHELASWLIAYQRLTSSDTQLGLALREGRSLISETAAAEETARRRFRALQAAQQSAELDGTSTPDHRSPHDGDSKGLPRLSAWRGERWFTVRVRRFVLIALLSALLLIAFVVGIFL